MTIRAVVKGVGHFLPDRIVNNSDFEASLNTSDEWIQARSGIKRRHFVCEGEKTSDMAITAANAALADAGLQANDLDAVLADTLEKFPQSIQPYIDMIEGQRMDLDKTRYATFKELPP